MQANNGEKSSRTLEKSRTKHYTENLDTAMMNFLKKYFPIEVKRKQKENERGMVVDQYGEEYAGCRTM